MDGLLIYSYSTMITSQNQLVITSEHWFGRLCSYNNFNYGWTMSYHDAI